MSKDRLVYSSEKGDLRKKTDSSDSLASIDEKNLILNVRRLTSGKGRTIIEITGLPNSKKWCQKLSKDLKKSIGVGGSFKASKTGEENYIELHGEKLDEVIQVLEAKDLRWKKTGG